MKSLLTTVSDKLKTVCLGGRGLSTVPSSVQTGVAVLGMVSSPPGEAGGTGLWGWAGAATPGLLTSLAACPA